MNEHIAAIKNSFSGMTSNEAFLIETIELQQAEIDRLSVEVGKLLVEINRLPARNSL